ncbi:CdaR family protein [Pseudalkalibacillus decolorationis]|uniref:CdaR family protein n=1 Tax=Pseudalkalibacillus decolorationis TaxID=163879 RepID=UPI0021490388|nr:CdaR family protein [Pseudalkalibacillus decolorationis]
MDRLLNSHWVVKIIAFLIALMMYTNVIITGDQQVDNNGDEGISNDESIYETLDLEARYDEDKYFLTGLPETVRVEFKGPQADLTKLRLQREQTAYIDLSGKGPGQYTMNIQVPNIPGNIDPIFQQKTVTVTLHEKKTEEFNISVQLINEDKLAEGYIPGTPELEMEKMEITGAKEVIDDIEYIRGFVNVEGAEETITQEVKLQAYDSNFDPIDINLDPATINVTVPIENPSKTVPVSIEQKGSLPEGIELKSATANEKEVTIHAPKDLLSEINGVRIPIDLSKITEDETIEVEVPLQEDAFYSTPGKVSVKIDVETVEETSSSEEETPEPTASTRTFSNFPIQVKGLSENEEASFIKPEQGAFELTVKGNEEDLQELTEEDIVAFVDVKSLEEGQHDVAINVEVPQKFTFEPNLSEATLTISNRSA